MISVIQRNTGNDSTGLAGQVVVSFGGDNSSGNTIVAIGFVESNNQSNLSTPTDTLGNTYIKVLDISSGTHFLGLKVWVAYNISAGANTVTMGDSNQLANLHIYEVSGLASSAAFDMSASQLQFSQIALSSGSTTPTTDANELLLGMFVSGLSTVPAWVPGSGYSNLQSVSTTFLESATEEQIVSSTGTYAATATVLNNNAYSLAAIVTFGDTPIREDVISNISDSTSLSESVRVNILPSINVSDSMATSENVNVNQALSIVTSDSTVTSENRALTNEKNINVNDTTTTSENVRLLGTSLIAVNDVTLTGESIDVVIVSSNVKSIIIDENINTSENIQLLIPTLLIVTTDMTMTSENMVSEIGTYFIIIMTDSVATSETIMVQIPKVITRTTSISMTVPGPTTFSLTKS